eukprot:2511209-Rhodomonas_salina.3
MSRFSASHLVAGQSGSMPSMLGSGPPMLVGGGIAMVISARIREGGGGKGEGGKGEEEKRRSRGQEEEKERNTDQSGAHAGNE